MSTRSRVLQLWVNRKLEGAVRVPIDSVAAKAVLKGFSKTAHVELRDPTEYQTYRYDPIDDRLYAVVN